jgi:ketosteroid isomerase-like protein
MKGNRMDSTWAHAFAEEWISAWNSHDLERILAHYSDDFEMSSPLIVERMHEPSGTLKGKDKVRPYWQLGLAATPPIKFELVDVFVGVDSIAIYYRSVGRKMAAEVLIFNDQRQVIKGIAHYGGPA